MNLLLKTLFVFIAGSFIYGSNAMAMDWEYGRRSENIVYATTEYVEIDGNIYQATFHTNIYSGEYEITQASLYDFYVDGEQLPFELYEATIGDVEDILFLNQREETRKRFAEIEAEIEARAEAEAAENDAANQVSSGGSGGGGSAMGGYTGSYGGMSFGGLSGCYGNCKTPVVTITDLN